MKDLDARLVISFLGFFGILSLIIYVVLSV